MDLTASDAAIATLGASTVLVYDRATTRRRQVVEILRAKVHRCLVAAEFEDAMGQIEKHHSESSKIPIDMVIAGLDVTCLRLLENLRARAQDASLRSLSVIPVVLIAQSDDPQVSLDDLIRQGMALGASGYIADRRVNGARILDRVASLLHKYKSVETAYSQLIDVVNKYPKFRLPGTGAEADDDTEATEKYDEGELTDLTDGKPLQLGTRKVIKKALHKFSRPSCVLRVSPRTRARLPRRCPPAAPTTNSRALSLPRARARSRRDATADETADETPEARKARGEEILQTRATQSMGSPVRRKSLEPVGRSLHSMRRMAAEEKAVGSTAHMDALSALAPIADVRFRPNLYAIRTNEQGVPVSPAKGTTIASGGVSAEMKPFITRQRPSLSSPRTAVGLSQSRVKQVRRGALFPLPRGARAC